MPEALRKPPAAANDPADRAGRRPADETRAEDRRELRTESRPARPANQPAGSESPTSLISLPRRHPFVAFAAAILFVIGVATGVIWWLNARQYESTDDAFIDARTVAISSQVNGAIVDVPVTDNQLVAAGSVLARIDDRDFRAAVDQAKAQIDQAQASIANFDAQIEAQQARIDQAQRQVTEAQAALTFAREEDARAQDLLRKGAGTQQRAQQTGSDLRQREAADAAARANLLAAQKEVAVLQTERQAAGGQLEQARAALEQADANFARTVITASIASRVTKLTAAKGATARPGRR